MRTSQDTCQILITVLVATSLTSLTAQGPPARRPTAVCGRVTKVTCDKKTLNATVLELKPKSKRLPVTIDASGRPAFQPSPEDVFLGAEICASGTTEVRDGKPRMILKAPGDVTIRTPSRQPQPRWTTPAWYQCDEGIEMPTLLREVKPQYPMQAMRALIQGAVLLEAVVLSDGTVGETRITRSLDRKNGLDREAVATVRQWLFNPGTKSGQPVPVVVSIEMSFTLK